MQISVTDEEGGLTFSLEVCENSTLETLRALIEVETGIPAGQQLLFVNMVPINAAATATLGTAGVTDGCLVLVARATPAAVAALQAVATAARANMTLATNTTLASNPSSSSAATLPGGSLLDAASTTTDAAAAAATARSAGTGTADHAATATTAAMRAAGAGGGGSSSSSSSGAPPTSSGINIAAGSSGGRQSTPHSDFRTLFDFSDIVVKNGRATTTHSSNISSGHSGGCGGGAAAAVAGVAEGGGRVGGVQQRHRGVAGGGGRGRPSQHHHQQQQQQKQKQQTCGDAVNSGDGGGSGSGGSGDGSFLSQDGLCDTSSSSSARCASTAAAAGQRPSAGHSRGQRGGGGEERRHHNNSNNNETSTAATAAADEEYLQQQAETLVNVCAGDASTMAVLVTENEALAAVLPAAVQEAKQQSPTKTAFQHLKDYLRKQLQERRKAEEARVQELNEALADPLSAKAQTFMMKQIQAQQVEDNYLLAQEHLPEAFGHVFMLYVPIEINGVAVKAFVDSGAQGTFMSQSCAQRCNLTRLMDTRYQGTALGVGKAQILGRIHLATLKIGQRFYPSSFTVLQDEKIPFLLGLDLLRRYQCCIDLKKNVLRIDDDEVPFLGEKDIDKDAFGGERNRMEERGSSDTTAVTPNGPATSSSSSSSSSSFSSSSSGEPASSSSSSQQQADSQQHETDSTSKPTLQSQSSTTTLDPQDEAKVQHDHSSSQQY